MPPPPPSRDATLSRVEAAPPAKAGQEGQGRAAVEGAVPAAGAATPPSRPQEETNGVAIVSQQELDFNTKVSFFSLTSMRCSKMLKDFV